MDLVITFIVASLFVLYVNYSKKRDSKEGELFFSNWLLLLAVAASILFLTILYLIITDNSQKELPDYLSMLFVTLFFGIASVVSIFAYKNKKVVYDNTTITLRSIFGKESKFNWSDIREVTFNRLFGSYILHLKSGQTFHLSPYLSGIELFLNRTKKLGIVLKG